MRRPVLAGVTVLLLGWAWIAVLGQGPTEGDLIGDCPPLSETGSYELETELPPPSATRCTVERPGGDVAVRTTTPWDAWVLVLSLAAAAALVMRRRLALAAALVLAGLATYFRGLP